MRYTGCWLLATVLLAGCSDPPPAGDGCPSRKVAVGLKTDHTAADGLWMIESGRPRTSVSVARLLTHPSAQVRRRAALAVGRIASPGLSRQLRTLLGDEDAAVRAAAAWSLGLADDALAEEPLLLRVALDDSVGVRVAALRSLGLVGGAGAARALLKLVVAPYAGPAGPVRTQIWRSLALLARRGSTLTHAGAPLALACLERSTPVDERRAAAYLLATLVQRYSAVRKSMTAKRRKRLVARFAAEKDAEARMQLGRVVIRLKLVKPAGLAGLSREGGTVGRLAADSLLKRDAAKGLVLGPLVDDLVKTLPAAAGKTVTPVVLWQLFGGLASGPRRRWVGSRASVWLEGVQTAFKKAAKGSGAAHQLARLTCRAAALADVSGGKVRALPGCGGGALSSGQEQAFLAWGLARGVTRRPFRQLRRLWVDGKVAVRAAVLTAAGRLGGDRGHALVSRGLAAKDPTIFGAGATACSALLKANPAVEGAGGGAIKHSCLVEARRQLLSLRMPPVFAQLYRWVELVRLVRGIADNAVVGRLKVAARHHHPTVRALARASLSAVLGRPPGATTWSADRRSMPVEPLTQPVTLKLLTAAGPITLRLRPDWAPLSAAYILHLVQKGAYAKSSFHRVVPGFVVQGGDPTGTGFGGDASFLLSELSHVRFRRGVVGLAHAGRDTESSQLFITLGPAPHLDGRYTAFAEVTSGLELADRLLPGATFRIPAPKGVPLVKAPPPGPAPAPAPPMRPTAKPGMKSPPEPVMKLSADPPGRPPGMRARGPKREVGMAPMGRPTMGFIKLSMGRSGPARPTMGFIKLSMDRSK